MELPQVVILMPIVALLAGIAVRVAPYRASRRAEQGLADHVDEAPAHFCFPPRK